MKYHIDFEFRDLIENRDATIDSVLNDKNEEPIVFDTEEEYLTYIKYTSTSFIRYGDKDYKVIDTESYLCGKDLHTVLKIRVVGQDRGQEIDKNIDSLFDFDLY